MSKDIVKRITLFDSTDLTAAEEYFSQMAQKGLMLKKYGVISHFTRCLPQKLRFSVQLLMPERGENYENKVREYVGLCEQAGWTFISNSSGMCVFVTAKDDIPDIVTDPQERIDAVTRQSRNGAVLLWLLSVIMLPFLLGLISGIVEKRSFQELLVNEIPFAICWASLLTMTVIRTVRFLKWRKAARYDAAAGRPIRYYDLRGARPYRVALGFCFALLGVSLVLFILGLFI